jgi:hypothetical protein
MFRSKNQKQKESTSTVSVGGVDNRLVILCQVYATSINANSETHILPVLAVLKRHKFQIKPVSISNSVFYFCELRDDVLLWSSQILDQAMGDTLPLDVRHKEKLPVYWSFG